MNATAKTFQKTDRLDRQPFCKKLERYLMIESDFVEGSLVAALNAPFGSGKTHFIEMWKEDLLTRRKSNAGETAFTAPMPVILNAWESDFCGDPLVDILVGLTDAVQAWVGKDAPDQKEKNKLVEASKNALLFTASIANGVASKFSGVDILKADEFVQKETKKNSPKVPDFISIYKERRQALQDLRQALEAAFSPEPPPGAEPAAAPGKPAPKIIIFVDELDRCRPDYAIHYLETIKHVFNVKGMIFLLAVDGAQLEVSARALFGNGLNFPEYFRKFCHRTIRLPKPEPGPLGVLIEDYIVKYITQEGKRSTAFSDREPGYYASMAEPMARSMELNLRQLNEAFRILGHALSLGEQTQGHAYNFRVTLAYMYLSFLRASENKLFWEIQRGEAPHSESFINRFRKLSADKINAAHWIEIYSVGNGIQESSVHPSFQKFVTDTTGNIKITFGEVREALGHPGHPKPMQLFCDRIENVIQFDDEASTS